MAGDKISLTYITADRKNAKRIARTLVEEKLAACCNILPIESIYWWKGGIEEAEERLLIAKTLKSREEKLIKRVSEIHTYTTPEILTVDVRKCEKKYADYVKESIK